MDGKNRAASSYLSPGNPPADKEQNDPLAQVFHNACSYNFFAMAELLHRLAKGEKGTPELSLRDDPAQETLRFSADASLAFPCSDISALKRDTSGAFRMTTTFMGLQGSQSPLPGYYLDHLAWKAVHEQSPVGDFLDMFSHRLTQFVWHIWRKYRYHISFRNGGVDAFSQRMYSLVGLGHRQLRDKLAINHSKICCAALCSTAAAMNCASRWMMPEHGKCTAIITKNWPPIASRGLRCCLTRSTPRSMTGCFVKNSGSRKHEQEGVSGLRADVRHINRLRNGEKNQ